MRKSPLLTCSGVAGLAVCLLFLSTRASIADEASAKAALAAKGVKASHAGLSLAEEGELTKAVNAATALRRKIPSSSSGSSGGGFDNSAEVQAEIEQLTERNAQLKQQLAQLNATPIAFKGPAILKLNQEISANDNAINQLKQSSQQTAKENVETQKDVKAARSAYTQAVFDARKMADRVLGQYAELSKDQEVITAVKAWNEATHTTHALKPSHTFDAALKRLDVLEKKIPSEKIPLKQEGTGYLASVAINGDVLCDMLVDSAASTVLLPHQTAIDAGLKVDDAAAMTAFQAGDGSEVQAHRAVLKTVRVGSFTARNVACGVLPASSTSKGVLGKSFLGQFKGKIDSLSGELSLARADTEGATRSHKKPVRHTRKKSSKQTQTEEPQE